MNPKIASALNTLSLGLAELAEALNDSQAVALPPATPAHAGAAPAQAASPAPASEPFSDGVPVEEPPLFPDQFEGAQPDPSFADVDSAFPVVAPYTAPAPTQQDIVLGRCPNHDEPWVARPGGVSERTGRAYSAFWTCQEKNPDGSYCSKKPEKAWIKTHDPEKALAAA